MISVACPSSTSRKICPSCAAGSLRALDETGHAWEIVLVDDGSADDSARLIRQYHADDPPHQAGRAVAQLRHQPAVTAGIHHAGGDCVVLIAATSGPAGGHPAARPQVGGGLPRRARRARSRADGRGARGVGFRLFYPVLPTRPILPHGPDAGIFGRWTARWSTSSTSSPSVNASSPGCGAGSGSTRPPSRTTAAAGPRPSPSRRCAAWSTTPWTRLQLQLQAAARRDLTWASPPRRSRSCWRGSTSSRSFALISSRAAGHDDHPQRAVLGGVQLICVGILGEYRSGRI